MAYLIGWLLLCFLFSILSLPFIALLKKSQMKKQAEEAAILKQQLAQAKRDDDFQKQVELESSLRKLGQ